VGVPLVTEEATVTVRTALGFAERLAVHAVAHAADRFTGTRTRRRILSPYVALVAEASAAGVDHQTALAVADRLLTGSGGTPDVRRLQRAAQRPYDVLAGTDHRPSPPRYWVISSASLSVRSDRRPRK
jgi:hypothetical protein